MTWTTVALMGLASLAMAIPVASADTNCNNYGMVLMVGVGQSYQCATYTQICEQGSGSGAGAGAGGPGTNQAGAEATAGSNCVQNNGNGTAQQPGLRCLHPTAGAGSAPAQVSASATWSSCSPTQVDLELRPGGTSGGLPEGEDVAQPMVPADPVSSGLPDL